MSRIPLDDLLKINLLDTLVGSETLQTTAQTVTGAINELDDAIEDIDTLVGSEELQTTSQTVTGAINELNNAIEDIETENDSWTNESQVFVYNGHKFVTFDNLNGEYGYALYCRNYLASILSMSIVNGTTEGTKKITYMLDDGVNTGEYCKLRIIR